MTRVTSPVGVVCLSLLIVTMVGPAVLGHHGTAVSYDSSRQVTVSGTVSEFWWRNPHSALFIDGTDDKGTPVKWAIEMSSPGVLQRAGWTRKTFVAGDAVSIIVNPSRAGTPVGVCLNPCTVTINGKPLSARE